MLIKIIIIGLSLCLINIFLKKQMSEFVLPIELVFISFAAFVLVEYFQDIFKGISQIMEQTEYGEELMISTVKAAGICLLTKFASDICDENGNKLISDVIEFTGRIMLTLIAVPYIEAIMKTAVAFTK